MNYFSTSLLCIGILATSCHSDEVIKKRDGDVVSSLASNGKTDAELEKLVKEFEKEERERLEKEKLNTTSLSFDKKRYDFGNVKSGSTNTTEFVVNNTGDKPLIIEDVSASCGCTTPKKPSGPILPGKSDVIEVSFKPNPGQVNEIIKTVTVTANTVEKVHKLEIRAFVIE